MQDELLAHGSAAELCSFQAKELFKALRVFLRGSCVAVCRFKKPDEHELCGRQHHRACEGGQKQRVGEKCGGEVADYYLHYRARHKIGQPAGQALSFRSVKTP